MAPRRTRKFSWGCGLCNIQLQQRLQLRLLSLLLLSFIAIVAAAGKTQRRRHSLAFRGILCRALCAQRHLLLSLSRSPSLFLALSASSCVLFLWYFISTNWLTAAAAAAAAARLKAVCRRRRRRRRHLHLASLINRITHTTRWPRALVALTAISRAPIAEPSEKPDTEPDCARSQARVRARIRIRIWSRGVGQSSRIIVM